MHSFLAGLSIGIAVAVVLGIYHATIVKKLETKIENLLTAIKAKL